MWILALGCFEILSFICVWFPVLNTVVALSVTAFIFWLTYKKPSWALCLVAVEYVIGSKGGLLRAFGDGADHGGVSLRILWFSAFLLGWFVFVLRHHRMRDWSAFLWRFWPYLILGVWIGFGFLRGYILHQPALYVDANAWGVWLLLLPVLDIAFHEANWLYDIARALHAALIWLAVKTLALFYLFSHPFPVEMMDALYFWIRRSGVGEITRIPGNAFRIFFQSHIYALCGFCVLWAKDRLTRLTRVEWWLLLMCIAQVLISLSRSLWLGSAVGALTMCIVFFITRKQVVGFGSWLGRGVVTAFCAFGLVVFLALIPIPHTQNSWKDLFVSRVGVGDAAAMSRWQLLPVLVQQIQQAPILGFGFGKTITYQSQDPRVVAMYGDRYTTYAFEWGWLDIWMKLGLIGVLLYLGILAWLIHRILRANVPFVWRIGWTTIVLTLAVTHVFTPYVNHPLGIVIVIGCEGWLMACSRFGFPSKIPFQSSSFFLPVEPR